MSWMTPKDVVVSSLWIAARLAGILSHRWITGLLLTTITLMTIWQVFVWWLKHTSRIKLSQSETLTATELRDTRKLNDDILQGFQGLLLTFHTACQRVSPEHVSRKLLEDALKRADLLLITTRQRAEQLAARTPSVFDPQPLNSGRRRR
jgi:hypothetical protein